jgi:outer membrane protein TolC
VVELRKENFFSGVGSNLDVLNAYQSKHNRERLWVSAIFDYFLQFVQLNINLGEVDAEAINQIDALLF